MLINPFNRKNVLFWRPCMFYIWMSYSLLLEEYVLVCASGTMNFKVDVLGKNL